MSSAEDLVRSTTSPTALRAATTIPDLLEAAISNDNLPDDLWFRFYPNAKVKVARAKDLAGRPLDAERRSHILTIETRSAAIKAMLEANAPTQEDLNALLDSPALTKKLASWVTEQFADLVSTEWLTAAGRKAGGHARTESWQRNPSGFDDAEIIEALTTYSTWGEDWDNERIAWLLATRPSVLEGAVRSDSDKVRTQAAGCRHLTDPALQLAVGDLDTLNGQLPDFQWVEKRLFTLMALVHNPVVPVSVAQIVDPILKARCREESKMDSAQQRIMRHPGHIEVAFEAETDPVRREWIIKRVRPYPASDFNARAKCRNHDLVAFMANPHLTDGEVTNMVWAIKRAEFVLEDQRVNAAYLEMLSRYPSVVADNAVDLTEIGQACAPRPKEAPHAYDRRRPVHENTHLLNARYFTYDNSAVTYFEETLESEDAWRFALLQLDEGFDGTIADLAMVSNLATL